MIKVYGSVKCPYCLVLKENLERNQVAFEFVEILESLGNLGSFLAIRDREPVFDHLKAVNDIVVAESPLSADDSVVRKGEKVWTLEC